MFEKRPHDRRLALGDVGGPGRAVGVVQPRLDVLLHEAAASLFQSVEKFNGQEIMIPNDEFITNRVTNWTHSNSRGRIDIKIGISYDSDIEKAMDIMVTTAKEHKNSSKSIESKCYLLEFTDSSVELLLFFWVDNIANKRLETKSDIMRSIWSSFKENNIITINSRFFLILSLLP